MKRTRKAIERARKNKPIRQVAPIPYRISAAGELQILLITSRTTGRFIVPKGWPQKRRSDRKTAALEALEEAGAIGRIHKRSIGSYRYWKRLGRRSWLRCTSCPSNPSVATGRKRARVAAPG